MEKETYTYEYPHPAVTTDCVIFGFDGRDLNILLVERGGEPFKGAWALPGGFVRMNETLEQGAAREIYEETNVRNIFLEQFYTFSAIDRDPRERVITVAFYALVKQCEYNVIGGDDAVKAVWFNWNELPPLAFDHAEIIQMAKKCLRERMEAKLLAFKLLNKRFKMSELQKIYELIGGQTLDRRNFQKKMLTSGLIMEANSKTDKVNHYSLNPSAEKKGKSKIYQWK